MLGYAAKKWLSKNLNPDLLNYTPNVLSSLPPFGLIVTFTLQVYKSYNSEHTVILQNGG